MQDKICQKEQHSVCLHILTRMRLVAFIQWAPKTPNYWHPLWRLTCRKNFLFCNIRDIRNIFQHSGIEYL